MERHVVRQAAASQKRRGAKLRAPWGTLIMIGRRFLLALIALVPLCHHATPAVATWKAALIEKLRSHIAYPEQAKTLGTEGLVVLVTFTVDRQGAVHDTRVIQSSGSSLLDDNALRTVSQAGPFPPPPPDLIGDRFSFTAPLRYLSHEQN
jgi:TonB family protein